MEFQENACDSCKFNLHLPSNKMFQVWVTWINYDSQDAGLHQQGWTNQSVSDWGIESIPQMTLLWPNRGMGWTVGGYSRMTVPLAVKSYPSFNPSNTTSVLVHKKSAMFPTSVP